jgi:UDP:flavonoid glycosyltransferase YjiC (YdhE family)
MKHLLVDVSAHGYGHVAQTAPVVNELARLVPGLRVTLRSAAPAEFLRQRFHCEFQHVPVALDFGMAMVNAVEVDVARSMAAYRTYHADWERKVARAAREMAALRPDLLFANVPYLSLAAAKTAGIPAVAMCCLNWADIYSHYAPDDAESRAIHDQMLAAYDGAEVFLKVRPTMPMPALHNALAIPPIAQLGTPRREHIAERSGWNGGERLVLVAMGGIEHRLTLAHWPRLSGVRWLVPQAWHVAREDMMPFDSLDMSFSDVLASCDAVLTKPGYGTFAEAACAGVPVLYVSRGTWPEQPYLLEWLRESCACREVTNEQLSEGDLSEALQQLWDQPRPAAPAARGEVRAAEMLASYL